MALLITMINALGVYLLHTAYFTKKEQEKRGYKFDTENVDGMVVFGVLLLFTSWYIITAL